MSNPFFKTFNSPGGQTTNGVVYVLDVSSGVFRPVYNTDLGASVNVSGLNLTVGAVALTGTSIVTLTGNTPVAVVSLPATQNVAVTGGSIQTIVTGTIGGNVTVSSVAVTGGTSGAALGSLDLAHTYLPVSGLGTFATTVSNTPNVVPIGGFVGITGTVTTSASVTVGNVAITGFNSTIAPLAVSGTFTATIGNVAVTGGNIVATDSISRGLLSGISGLLATNLTSPVFVSGDSYLAVAVTGNPGVTNIGGYVGITGTHAVTIGNTNPIAVSGVVLTVVTGSVSTSISNPIGVTGVAIDTSLPVINGFAPHFLPIGGKIVTASGAGSISGYNSTGDMAMLNICQTNGGLFVNQGVLDQTQDNVTTWPASSGTVASSSVSGINNAGWGVVLPNNPSRRGWYIQNLSTGTMFGKLGTAVSSGNCNFVLKGGVVQNDGLGSSWSDVPAIYTGPVEITGYFSVTPTFVAWQI